MTEGNQGKAWDAAKAALKLDPNNTDLQAGEARAKAALNTSLARSKQKTKD